MKRATQDTPPCGFTLLEIVAALAGLAVAVAILGHISFWSLTDRKRSAVRHEALEAAANILETAAATPWEALTPDWAAAQRLPDDLAQRMYQPQLKVRTEPDAAHQHIKRVTVEIAWQLDQGVAARPVVLAGWFSSRSASGKGGKP